MDRYGWILSQGAVPAIVMWLSSVAELSSISSLLIRLVGFVAGYRS